MSSHRNNYKYGNTERTPVLPITTNLSVNQGDLVYWDATNYTVTPLTAASQVAGAFLGVSGDTDPFKVYSETGYVRGVKVLRNGVFSFNTTNGETYNPMTAVTATSDPQTVTTSSASSTNRVGFAVIDPPSTPRASAATPAPEHVTGAAGVYLNVLIESKYPSLLS
jgi:hypothetical protein